MVSVSQDGGWEDGAGAGWAWMWVSTLLSTRAALAGSVHRTWCVGWGEKAVEVEVEAKV
eukprot:m.167606 g.167606  ORF g.167606 m.167606 type:complete len:59 (-) comp12847_c0_seq1:12-188(-)